ncbi:MAG TPA: PIN domain-containing protein [Thermomicrobiales bacterium]|nr:PIN domain-containing protein [Thermomicrobiales bacterium]
MRPDAFLDTNVILRQVLQDHPDHSPRATALIVATEQGHRAVRLADTVVFEAAFTLEKTYGVPRSEIRDALVPILDLAGIVLPGKRLFTDVFDLYVREAGLSFADCYHATLAKHLELRRILSFDRKMGRIPGVERIEP